MSNNTTPTEQIKDLLQRVYNYGYLAGSNEGKKDFEAYELMNPDNVDADKFLASLRNPTGKTKSIEEVQIELASIIAEVQKSDFIDLDTQPEILQAKYDLHAAHVWLGMARLKQDPENITPGQF